MDSTTIVDLAHPMLEPMLCLPGDPGYQMTLACTIPLVAAGAAPKSVPAPDTDQPGSDLLICVHAVSFSTHTGTHIDAPFHFFPSGRKLHEFPLTHFVGRAVILDIRHLVQSRRMISWADLTSSDDAGVGALTHIGSRTDGKADIVLFRTGWDVHWATPTYFSNPYFSRDVAIALHNLGAKIVGMDMPSPDETPAGEKMETEHGWGMHDVLLGHGVLICENMRGLGELAAAGTQSDGEETWVSLAPLNIQNADGGPVRAFGWKQLAAAC